MTHLTKSKLPFLAWALLCLAALIVALTAGPALAQRGLRVVAIKDKAGNQVGLYRESHALVIGVSDYTAGWPKLPGVKSDIRAVKAALEDRGFQVVTVLDPDSAQLEGAFKKFVSDYGDKAENRLLFYFAGHGHTLKPKYGGEPLGYIVPRNAPNPNRDLKGFKRTALSMQRIEEYALNIDAKHALFMFDSCFSGSLFSLSRAVPANISYKTAQPVRQFITAGTADESVPDVSIFRRQFVAALNGEGDVDGDGYVTGTELGEFLQKKVVNYSKGAQHPQYGRIRNPNLDKGDFVFLMAGGSRLGAAAGRPAPSAPPPPRTIDAEESFWKAIESSTQVKHFQAYLRKYPNGRFADVAKIKIDLLQPSATAYGPASRPPQQAAVAALSPALPRQPAVEDSPALSRQPAVEEPVKPPAPPPEREATTLREQFDRLLKKNLFSKMGFLEGVTGHYGLRGCQQDGDLLFVKCSPRRGMAGVTVYGFKGEFKTLDEVSFQTISLEEATDKYSFPELAGRFVVLENGFFRPNYRIRCGSNLSTKKPQDIPLCRKIAREFRRLMEFRENEGD